MKKLLAILILLTIGCATQLDVEQWEEKEPDPPGLSTNEVTVKHTRITQSWWLGIFAIAPSDVIYKDGDIEYEAKAVDLPTVDIGTLFRRDD